jgi:hypothetical protein
MKALLACTILGAAACHPSGDAPGCEKDLFAVNAPGPFCLSDSLRATTLDSMLSGWCRIPNSPVHRSTCGDYTLLSSGGQGGAETLYFDKTGHVVARQSSSLEWGGRVEGELPKCSRGPETNPCGNDG